MRILFYEPRFQGHHFTYLSRMLPGFLDAAADADVNTLDMVLATTQQALDSHHFRDYLAPFGDSLDSVPHCTEAPPGVLKNSAQRFSEFATAVRTLRPDHACVMYGDGLWQIWAAHTLAGRGRFPIPVEMWLYRGGFTYPEKDSLRQTAVKRIKQRLFQQLLSANVVARLNLDDEYLHDYAVWAAARTGSTTRIELTPNPVRLFEPMTKAAARAATGLPIDGPIAVLHGSIGPRKGSSVAMEARLWLDRQGVDSDARLVLAGPHISEAKAQLAEPRFASLIERQRVISHDRFLTEEQMYQYAAAADLVLAPYPNHSGRSSIVLWAAAAGRPSLGAARGCVGRLIRQNNLGLTVDPNDIPALANAISQGLRLRWSPGRESLSREYAAFHSVENYRKVAAGLVRARLKNLQT